MLPYFASASLLLVFPVAMWLGDRSERKFRAQMRKERELRKQNA